MAQNFKISVGIRHPSTEREAHYKEDGLRFGTQKTVKLCVQTVYELQFRIKPHRELTNVQVDGVDLALKEASKSEDQIVYTADWDTQYSSVTKKANRYSMLVLINIKDLGTMKTTIQSKFYNPGDSHLTWGSRLNNLEYDCKVNEDRAYVDIVKETFR
ncbi:CB1 cannabinoid receptor-interacting protein 1 [Lingula anatina]|uniref:CB1 cannabinoid receptor-interacting protein 1 n=1 Tax=Lingula anatina TaxID=7574 RepID=A0A1S3JDU0_LINAN|nr:CB1 cannabinoid receptor-interacting protein 1 [Lingula anatina]|eukprot:XP_013408498.1 CB1 cannabinoid receptor-interacting protein 1 [Lingula anatina]